MTGSEAGRLAVWAVVGVALLASGFALAGLPLLEAPGWELATALALLAAAAGGPAGIAAARRELRRAAPGEAPDRPAPSPLRAAARSAAAVAGAQAALAAGAAARTALLTPCSATAGLAFLPVLALPSAVLAASLGTLAGLAAGGRRLRAGLLYAGLAALSLGTSLLEAWRGPAAYVLDPLLGTWPGPIYDEALSVDRRLFLSRLETLAWAAAAVAAAALLARRRARPPAPGAAAGRLPAPALALLLSLCAVGGLRLAAAATGDRATHGRIARALGGRIEGARCDLRYPSEKARAEAERLWRGCELDAAEIAGALGLPDPPRVRVWLYRSADEKRRLTGAGRTDFTKPWLREVHVLDAPGGPASLRHELVHALAGPVAGGPLGVPARAGIWVNAGLVEGLAVALDLPRGEWTAHEQARAMRDLGLLPPASRLVEPAGFLAAPPARAYAASGSLLRFLLERHGPAPVRRAYGGAPFAEAFGRPLPALEADWLAFLDGIPVPPELAAEAEARFRPGGLLARRCAREVAGLEARARALLGTGRGPEAAALWRRAAALSADPADLRAAGDALRASDPAAAERTWAEALAALGPGASRPALRAALLDAIGDARWRSGEEAAAAARWREALLLRPGGFQSRLLQAKLAAAADPALAPAAEWLAGGAGGGAPGTTPSALVAPSPLGGGPSASGALPSPPGGPAAGVPPALARLSALDHPLAAYLAGRAAAARGDPRAAAERLERALLGELPGPAFRVEALRVLGEARCASGDLAGALAAFAELARTSPREAERERALAAARRCEAERAAAARDAAHVEGGGVPSR